MRGRVIRAENTSTVTRRLPNPEDTRVVSARQQKAAMEAEAHIVEARQRANRLLERAEQEAQRLRDDALEQARADAATLLATLTEQAAQRGDQLFDEARQDLVRLAVAIAEKLLGAQLELEPERIASIAAEVVRGVGVGQQLVLRVHPDDLPYLQQRLAELTARSGADGLTLEADLQISRGGCVVESPVGQVNGQLETQLKNLARRLSSDG